MFRLKDIKSWWKETPIWDIIPEVLAVLALMALIVIFGMITYETHKIERWDRKFDRYQGEFAEIEKNSPVKIGGYDVVKIALSDSEGNTVTYVVDSLNENRIVYPELEIHYYLWKDGNRKEVGWYAVPDGLKVKGFHIEYDKEADRVIYWYKDMCSTVLSHSGTYLDSIFWKVNEVLKEYDEKTNVHELHEEFLEFLKTR